ncbi:alpha/beta fold hydrolase [Flavobacterium anhuiense]|uniref:Pimeloyl-ACP methyl ester carboxylesterase n=1 Tax=Flavobacterium anhuiense TaxID=459526 RepID=A0ABY0M080_9FLAO|nr:alpha/beta hydrolase [Flavobacterium anhuiense]URM37271.1 alpha/beta hydrolase [Flavobacterium anhuiense]SCY86225.1 Pimeloyl-ACP methyl ester carboxylesterase [Flavobacterium anhuiense]
MGIKKGIRFITLKSVGSYINFLSYVRPQKAMELSYALFSQPRIGRLKKEELPKVLRHAETEIFHHNEHHFQTYVWKGNETKILLVHGWESNAARWKKTLPHLQKSGSTIIAIDAPAHGQSSGKEFNVPLYAEFINKAVEKYQPEIIIGHSIGGAACVYHQYLFPNTSINKMVILGAPSDLKTLIDNYISMLSLNRRMLPLLESKFINRFNFKLEDFSGQKFASEITIPGFIAHDTSDKIVAFAEGKKIAQGWKNSQFIETSGLGHGMHDDDLYNKVIEFLFEGSEPLSR